MKLLTKLEKNKTVWYLLGLSLLFFLLRLPSLIEPNWYGDEGIYQVIGLAMNKGRLLYTQIWDNKPPLLYLVYALFHGDQFQVRLFSLITGVFTVWAFFYLAKLLFKESKPALTSTIIFVLLFATPLLEGNIANAENFMLLPIIVSGLLIYKLSIKNYTLNAKRYTLALAGLLLGIAFLFKIVAVFDFAAFLLFLFIASFPNNLSLRGSASWRRRGNLLYRLLRGVYNDGVPFAAGFLAPLIITALYFIFNHAFSDFIKAVFSSNVGYVGWKNNFIIPQGFLILKLIILCSLVFFIFRKRKQVDKSFVFIILWFAFSLFNTFFSGRPYTHYVLVLLPAWCLLVGLFLAETKPKLRSIVLITLLLSTTFIISNFKPNIIKAFRYYGNAISFINGKKDVVSYQSFFDQKTPRDYEIASFIRTHTNSADNVFIWGDSAQIYALSNKLPPGKYTVAYHINQYKSGLAQTQADLNNARPKYIVTLPESRPIPFYLSTYGTRFVFRDVVLYERDL